MKNKEQLIQSGIIIFSYCILTVILIGFIIACVIAGYNINLQITDEQSKLELNQDQQTETIVQGYTSDERMLNEIFELTYDTLYRCVKVANINNTYYFDYTAQDLTTKYTKRNSKIEDDILEINNKIRDTLNLYNCSSEIVINVVNPENLEQVYFMIENNEITFTIYDTQKLW